MNTNASAAAVAACIAATFGATFGARADCLGPQLPQAQFPFDGARVPIGSTLRFFDPFGRAGQLPGVVGGDDISAILDTEGVAAGFYEWNNSVVGLELVDPDDVANEGVALDLRADDDEAPDAPNASAERFTKPASFSVPFLFDDCGSSPARDIIRVFVRSEESFGLVMIDGVGFGATGPDGTLIELPAPNSGQEFSVSVLDLAGNQSDDTVILVDGGCGCASSDTPATPMALVLAAFFFGLRRRLRV